MAQLSHELRTPLNAVIGFSELMVRELHGPLGNARYQEYAHHISQSGGWLLRSSEEALAVTEAMTALMADRRGAKRERRFAAALVRDAWRTATSAMGGAAPRLVLTTCTTCDLTCERRPTVQALAHLLREASAYAGAPGAITVTGRRQAGRRSVEISVLRAGPSDAGPSDAGPSDAGRSDAGPSDAGPSDAGRDAGPSPAASSGLHLILARLLLEMQGATLACTSGAAGWAARIEFSGRG